MAAYDWGLPVPLCCCPWPLNGLLDGVRSRRRRVRPAQARRCRAQLKTWGCRPPVGRGVTHHNRGLGAAGRMADEVWEGNLKYE